MDFSIKQKQHKNFLLSDEKRIVESSQKAKQNRFISESFVNIDDTKCMNIYLGWMNNFHFNNKEKKLIYEKLVCISTGRLRWCARFALLRSIRWALRWLLIVLESTASALVTLLVVISTVTVETFLILVSVIFVSLLLLWSWFRPEWRRLFRFLITSSLRIDLIKR